MNHIYSTFEETVKWEIKLGSPDLGLKKKKPPKQSELDFVQCLLGGPGRPFQKIQIWVIIGKVCSLSEFLLWK